MRIEWLISGTDPKWREEDYRDGGYVYENYVRNILKIRHELHITYLSRGDHKFKLVKFVQFCRYILNNLMIKFKGEITIRDVYSTVFAPFDKKRKNVVVIHHLETSKSRHKIFYRFLFRRFFKKVCSADGVVVVSEYWKDILEKAGCKNVSLIYNSFNINICEFEEKELSDFQKRLGIPRGKAIIYLGNAIEKKGYLEAYKALKDIDVVFVATGRQKVDLPIIQKFLSYSDYLKLLKISSLVLTMSKFDEGWCRTAHEALLCGTPVIGTGRGGMRELLEKGGQIICDDFADLRPKVLDLLNKGEMLADIGKKGREFAQKFTLDYFETSWMDFLLTLCQQVKMRILHILTSARIGGIERLVLDLSIAQSKSQEVEVKIMFIKETGKFLKEFKRARISHQFLNLKSGYDLSPKKLMKAFQVFKSSDILHFHSFNPFLAFIAILSGKKIVYTEHGNFGFGKQNSISNYLKYLLQKRFLTKKVNYLTFNSKFSKQIAEERYKLTDVKKSIVYNGISLDRKLGGEDKIEERILNRVRGKFVVGTVSRFKPYKYIDRLIKAFADFQSDKDTILLLVGDGVLRDKLEQLIQDLGLTERTIFTGLRSDIRQFQNLMDVCVFPFQNEGFGLVAVEALSMGKPVIVFKDGGGIAEIVSRYSRDNVVIDIKQLIEKLNFYYFNKNEINKKVLLRKEYAKKFDINTSAAKFHGIYKQILSCAE